ncbi:MAG TPA: EscU/YscU/HrcU family type III secretion system export apparatus switch protein [Myxococcaceae bacterium]|nr:EscU/YscU/HrcU family type III secretion system export apparatus switch protein [Myxococcaceae bacterium]
MSTDRTEDPTPRRLRQARERGQVPRSRLFSGSLVLAGASAGAALGLGGAADALRSWTAALLVQGSGVPAALQQALALLVRACAPALAGAVLAAVLAGLLTSGWAPCGAALVPRLERLDPLAGLKRLFSWRMAAELGRSVLVAALLLALLGAGAWSLLPSAVRLPAFDPPGAGLALLRPEALRLWTQALLLAAALGVMDLLLARRRHRRSLRMSRDEVRREHREQEGDPRHRAHRRAAHRQLLLAGRARGVKAASVVVVNPVHVAVALRWAPEECDAPYLVARGREERARAIRAEALALGIPVVRDVALARGLVQHDVGEEVPEELYRAAAVVLQHALDRPEGSP